MSLDTVLKIGKALRNTNDNLKYFKYVAACPKDNDGNYPLILTILVNKDFSFDWSNIHVTPENERDKLYYLVFTTSNNDSSPKKYGFGDIYYTRKTEIDKSGKIKGIKDYGNFTFEKGEAKNAFFNGQKQFNEIKQKYLNEYIISLFPQIESDKDSKLFYKAVLDALLNKKVEVK